MNKDPHFQTWNQLFHEQLCIEIMKTATIVNVEHGNDDCTQFFGLWQLKMIEWFRFTKWNLLYFIFFSFEFEIDLFLSFL